MKVHEALNLYSLHSKPETLDKHTEMQELLQRPYKWVSLNAFMGNVYKEGYKILSGNNIQDLSKALNQQIPFFGYQLEQFTPKKLSEVMPFWPRPERTKNGVQTIKKFKEIVKTINPQSIFCISVDEGDNTIIVTNAPITIMTMVVTLED